MAETTPTAGPPPVLVDNPLAPTTFAEEAFGFLILNGNVHITFTNLQADHSAAGKPGTRIVIGRLVMPMVGAQALAAGLYDFLKQRGFDPVLKPTDPQQIQ